MILSKAFPATLAGSALALAMGHAFAGESYCTIEGPDIITYKVAGCQNRSDVDRLFGELLNRGHGQTEETKSKNGKTSLVFTMFSDSALS